MISKQVVTLKQGETLIPIDVSTFGSGMYIVSIINEQQSIETTFVMD